MAKRLISHWFPRPDTKAGGRQCGGQWKRDRGKDKAWGAGIKGICQFYEYRWMVILEVSCHNWSR